MTGLPNSVRILLALERAQPASAKDIYHSLGLSVRAGNAALRMLRQAGWVEPGGNRWVRLTELGVEAAAEHRKGQGP